MLALDEESQFETNHRENSMSKSIHQLEDRLNELENLRRQRQSWLNDLITPMTERLHYLAEMRSKSGKHENNVIQFPLERRLGK